MTGLTPEIAATTLACLPKMTPGRLRALLDFFGDPVSALAAVQTGHLDPAVLVDHARVGTARDLEREWQREAAPERAARQLERRGTHVFIASDPGYPISDTVPDRPAILLAEGDRPEVLDAPRVAVVGTRAATPHGVADARDLGIFLANAGVTVVSGLAIGIDAAVHRGTLDAGGGTVGVVATGLDIEYPRRNVALYDGVRRSGLVIGETGFGVGPHPGRFPVRNRIIAALADVVVVVEATLRGGARITAQYALDYGRTVLALPGSRRNAAAQGTNALIADGAHPLIEWSDVLVALGLAAESRREARTPNRRPPSADGSAVLAALGGEAATPDQLASRASLSPERVAVAVIGLERAGWIERAQGAIWPT